MIGVLTILGVGFGTGVVFFKHTFTEPVVLVSIDNESKHAYHTFACGNHRQPLGVILRLVLSNEQNPTLKLKTDSKRRCIAARRSFCNRNQTQQQVEENVGRGKTQRMSVTSSKPRSIAARDSTN